MNKNLWTRYQNEPPCPHCEHGRLYDFGKDQSFETLDSRIENEFQPAGVISPSATFLGTGHIQCSNCKEIVIVSYKRIEDVRHTDEEGNEINFIEPLFYYPAPPIIKIPESCPKEILELLRISFQLYWVDLGSCVNKVRISIECLLTQQNVPKKGILHNRIEAFQKLNPIVGEMLLAIKWIGNSGSHHDAITREAVLDGYELLEFALENLYNDKEARLIALSKKINNNKGHV